jgi:hypothetical protein
MRESMDLQQIKSHVCPVDQEEAILLVDVETETIPKTDSEGNLQYYCLGGSHVFSVDEQGAVVQGEVQKIR